MLLVPLQSVEGVTHQEGPNIVRGKGEIEYEVYLNTRSDIWSKRYLIVRKGLPQQPSLLKIHQFTSIFFRMPRLFAGYQNSTQTKC